MLGTECFISLKYKIIQDDKQFSIKKNIVCIPDGFYVVFVRNFFENRSHVYIYIFLIYRLGNKLAFHFRISCTNEILSEKDKYHLNTDSIVQTI